MKYLKRADLYTGSNVTYSATKQEAFSYEWWQFVAVIKGKLVFNNYNYSPTTIKHQYKVLSQMRELGHEVDLFIQSPAGLQSSDGLQAAIDNANGRLKVIKKALSSTRRKRALDEQRLKQMNEIEHEIAAIKELMA